MRIIAGEAKGRRLVAPHGTNTRPMTDRMRESMFASLGSRTQGAHVLDLYAGSGTLGLEALSRGAADVVFVERNRGALQALRRNIEAVGLGGKAVGSNVTDYLRTSSGGFDLAFVDPPYDAPLASVEHVLGRLDALLAGGAEVVVHRRSKEAEPAVPAGWRSVSRRRFGGSELYRYSKEGP